MCSITEVNQYALLTGLPFLLPLLLFLDGIDLFLKSTYLFPERVDGPRGLNQFLLQGLEVMEQNVRAIWMTVE